MDSDAANVAASSPDLSTATCFFGAENERVVSPSTPPEHQRSAADCRAPSDRGAAVVSMSCASVRAIGPRTVRPPKVRSRRGRGVSMRCEGAEQQTVGGVEARKSGCQSNVHTSKHYQGDSGGQRGEGVIAHDIATMRLRDNSALKSKNTCPLTQTLPLPPASTQDASFA